AGAARGRDARAAAPVVSDGIVRAFGPGGPHVPTRDAAAAFSAGTGQRVEVTFGPEANWTAAAQAGADLLFGSSEQSMVAFLKTYRDFDVRAVEPIAIRRAVLLVQPGNPKGITGLEDLMRPGMKVIVNEGGGVSNTSGTGLWEDVVGRLGRLEDVRRLRANIVSYNSNSGTSFRLFRDAAAGVDAWITWVDWHAANPGAGELVEIEPERRIFRTANVVLRPGADPAAGEFIAFLKGPEGRRIFARYGYTA
uniref:substrate-binding domain-containing protein n=1 Tax=Elioraea rosea TaxID=2492390 RepID=UPI0011865422